MAFSMDFACYTLQFTCPSTTWGGFSTPADYHRLLLPSLTNLSAEYTFNAADKLCRAFHALERRKAGKRTGLTHHRADRAKKGRAACGWLPLQRLLLPASNRMG